jgi:hypothetical protein
MTTALFVARGGVYYGLPDADPWDEAREHARRKRERERARRARVAPGATP